MPHTAGLGQSLAIVHRMVVLASLASAAQRPAPRPGAVSSFVTRPERVPIADRRGISPGGHLGVEIAGEPRHEDTLGGGAVYPCGPMRLGTSIVQTTLADGPGVGYGGASQAWG